MCNIDRLCVEAEEALSREEMRGAISGLVAAAREMEKRWNYIKTDTRGARSLLLLLENGKGTPREFDTMVDRIIESRQKSKKFDHA
jgi:hypothetical protein